MKAYSSVIAFVGILALVIVPIYHITFDNQDYLNIVTKSFQVTKAEFYALNIQAWAQISKKGLSEEQLNDIYRQIIDVLNIKKNPTINNEYEGFINIYQKEVINNSINLEISLQSFLTEGQEKGTYLGIQVLSKDMKSGTEYYQKVTKVFADLGTDTDIGFTLVGTYEGDLLEKDKYKIIAKAFSSVGAKIVEGINSEGLISFSAYTNRCKDYLDVDGKKINLNIAIRYHAIDNKTYIHIGAPLIFQEY